MHDALGRDGVRRCRKLPRKTYIYYLLSSSPSHPKQTDSEDVRGGVVANANTTDEHVSAYLPSKPAAVPEGEYYKQVGVAD